MIYELSSLSLPLSMGIERELPPRVSVDDDSFYLGYDRTTLFYDCFFDDENKQLRMYAPSLLNLKSVFDALQFRTDTGELLKWAVRRRRCFDVLQTDVKTAPSTIELASSKWISNISVGRNARKLFADARVLSTVNKDNDLKWVRDWVIYHQRNHDVDAVVIVDNGSSAYSIDELLAVVSDVVGERSAVISAPLPYGPTKGARSGLGRAKFFQTAMLNLVRDRFLATAQGVLSIDVDELVVSKRGDSIFNCLRNSWAGFVSFNGEWRYPEDAVVRSHGAHYWIAEGDQACPSKYCYRPNSPLGSMSLGVHGLQHFSRQWMPASRDFFFAHCRNISTGWKWGRGRRLEISKKDERLLLSLQSAGLAPSTLEQFS